MSLFPEHPERCRIAAFVGPEFPVAAEAEIYDQLDGLADALDAELRVVHEVVADPGAQPTALRGRCGTGLFVPQDPLIHRNDVEHLRRTLGDRFAAVLAALGAIGQCSTDSLLAHAEIRMAFSMTRWVRGYQPQLIVSFGLGETSMQSMVASYMLDVPRVLVLDRARGDTAFALLLAMQIQQAQWVIATSESARAELLQRFGDGVRTKLVAATGAMLATPALVAAVGARLNRARQATQPRLGPDAAFRTDRGLPPRAAAKVHAFLVLGTARSGTNLLVGMLSAGHAEVECAGELFNPRTIDEGQLAWLPRMAVDEAPLLRLRRASPLDLHDRLLQDGAALGATRVGFKLLYYHGLVDDRVTDALVARDDLAIVHLTRRDRLARCLSMRRASTSDLWMVPKGEPKPGIERERIDLRVVASDFAMIELFEQRYFALFRNHRGCTVDYSELVSDQQAVTRRFEQLLDLEFHALPAQTRKIGPRDLAQAIENLSEIRAAMAGTRWAELVPPEFAGPTWS